MVGRGQRRKVMRKPTSPDVMYEWHRRALRGLNPPITMNEPQCGWFIRATGPKTDKETKYYPARIYLDQQLDGDGELTEPEVLKCEVSGKPRDPYEEWTWLAKRPISREEYRRLIMAGVHFDEPEPDVQAQSPQPQAKIQPRTDRQGTRVPF